MKVDDFIEKEGSACCPRKPRGDQLVPVGEEGVALRAGEEALAPNVLQVDAAHLATLDPFLGGGSEFFPKVCVFCVVSNGFFKFGVS